MRALSIIFGAMFITAATQLWALESDMFSIHQFAVSHSSPVSFSIEYPKGWKLTQDSTPHFGEAMTMDQNWICTFWPTNFTPTNYAGFTIFRSRRVATVQEAADELSKVSSRIGIYTQKSFSSVKTGAGESGYLVESEANFDDVKTPPILPKIDNAIGAVRPIKLGRVVLQEYFFHSGSKGSIRIEILTREVDSSFRLELNQMVLKTLRFGA
jgi:hypothetical protein